MASSAMRLPIIIDCIVIELTIPLILLLVTISAKLA